LRVIDCCFAFIFSVACPTNAIDNQILQHGYWVPQHPLIPNV
jgi:hypothetical protein